MIMQIPNVVYPYDNTVRNITKSTFETTLKVLRNLKRWKGSCLKDSLKDKYQLIIGIKCNVLYKFVELRKLIEANILNIILSYEDMGFLVRPFSEWIMKITPTNQYLYEAYLTIGLGDYDGNAICGKIFQLEQSIVLIYPDQIFRYKIRPVSRSPG